MNKIISKEQFSEKVFKLEIEAPLIAKSRRAGHFVIVRVDEKGERMPYCLWLVVGQVSKDRGWSLFREWSICFRGSRSNPEVRLLL